MRFVHRWHQTTLAFGLAGLFFAGCRSMPPAASAQQHATIHARAQAHFPQALLFKPEATNPSRSLMDQFAPLILLQVADTAVAGSDTNPCPQVFVAEGTVLLNGQPHRQVSYSWQHLGSNSDEETSHAWQIVRLTLDSAGLPMIWEALDESVPEQILFVSQNLEATAAQRFGPPLPGRRFAVERSATETPQVVVARLLDDAPMPMGPVVYLDADGKISSIACRCMPTQAGRLLGSANYRLASAKDLSVAPPPPGNENLTAALRLPSRD